MTCASICERLDILIVQMCISYSSIELGRRQHLLLSVNLGVLGTHLSGTDDPTIVLNSVLGQHLPLCPIPALTSLFLFFLAVSVWGKGWLRTLSAGAYGLPQLPGSGGFKLYDDFDQEYMFGFPRSWVGRSNSLRQCVYVSEFNVSSLLSCHISASIDSSSAS